MKLITLGPFLSSLSIVLYGHPQEDAPSGTEASLLLLDMVRRVCMVQLLSWGRKETEDSGFIPP